MIDYTVKPIDYHVVKEWILKRHYARRLPQIVYAFGLFEKRNIIGILTFGRGPVPSISKAFGEYHMSVYEFNRLCINLPLERRKNVATWFCSRAIKMLPKSKILISYSDTTQGHIGYVYQALNWLYTGEGSVGTYGLLIDDGTVKHTRYRKKWMDSGRVKEKIMNKPKYRYIYIHGDKRFKRNVLKILPWEILSYPKGESKRYNDTAEIKDSFTGFGLIKHK